MKKGIFILAFAMVSFSLSAQNTKPLIHLMPLFAQGIGAEESRLVESLIQSYLSDFGEVISSIDASLGANDLQGPLPAGAAGHAAIGPRLRLPDYTLSGNIYLERDSLIFMLEIGTNATGETSSFTLTSKSIGELVLKARSLVETAFSVDPERVTLQESPPLALSEAGVLGNWRGEQGIEMIRLQRMGRGLAVFSSGAQMALTWSIEDNLLRIRQVSPNSERYYHPLPYEVAKQLAARAEPMVWELRLYENGNALRGLKTFTGVRYEGEKITEIKSNEMLHVEWTRSGR